MLKKINAIAIKSFALLLVLGTAYQAVAQAATTPPTTTPYANMAPIDQYLMADRAAEIDVVDRALALELQSREPDDGHHDADQDRDHEAADDDVMRARLHDQLTTVRAARPRGPSK